MTAREKVPTPAVLVVDDEALIRWALSERLTEDGYTVRLASTASEALVVLKSLGGQPLVVVLDIRLPDAADLGLLRRIRHARPDAAVIILTANGSADEERVALGEGAFRYLRKPFDVSVVATLVAEAGRALPS